METDDCSKSGDSGVSFSHMTEVEDPRFSRFISGVLYSRVSTLLRWSLFTLPLISSWIRRFLKQKLLQESLVIVLLIVFSRDVSGILLQSLHFRAGDRFHHCP